MFTPTTPHPFPLTSSLAHLNPTHVVIEIILQIDSIIELIYICLRVNHFKKKKSGNHSQTPVSEIQFQ